MTPQEIAKQLADDFEASPGLWTTGKFRSDKGRMSAEEAVRRMSPVGLIYTQRDIEYAFYTGIAYGLVACNDAPGRTVQEVIAALRKVENVK